MKRGGPLVRRTPLKRAGLSPGKPIRKRKKNPQTEYLRRLFSLIVRHRDNYTCHWCERTPKTTPGLVLHAAHIYSVGSQPRMRFMLENALTLCYRDHIHRAHRDGGLMEWCDEHLPQTRMARLHLAARSSSRAPKPDLAGVRLYLEAEAARLGCPLPPAPKVA